MNIPDTTGYCLPDEFGEKIRYLKEHVDGIDDVILSVHCHDDLGMATANTVQAIRSGARQVEVTMNGVGERAGNTALEEIAMILRGHKELDLETGINTTRLFHTSRLVSSLMNMPVQPNKAVVGRNAFSHSSGIHQDGIIKLRETYGIIDPRDVGMIDNTLVLTARSGRAALKKRFMSMGVEMDGEALDSAYDRFLKMADVKLDISDDDLLMIAGKKSDELAPVRLDFLNVVSGKGVTHNALVRLTVEGRQMEAQSEGNGPVDAAIKAVKKIILKKMTIREFLIQAMDKGSDDTGKVHMQVEYDRRLYYGFSANTDIVTASVEAFISAVNKFYRL